MALTLCISSPARALEACPARDGEASELPATRAEIQELARRAFDGYRSHDNRLVREARCDIDRALPRTVEPLGSADVSRIHLVHALDESISGGPPEAVIAFLVAARAADPYPDDLILALTEEGDELLEQYRAAASAAQIAGYAEAPRALPPAWRGQVRVNGLDEVARPNGPYVMQVIGDAGMPKLTEYRVPDDDTIRYTRLRPVVASLAGGTAVLGLASLGVGAAFAAKGSDWEVSGEGSVAGSILQAELDAWQAEQDRSRDLNHAFLGAACGFGVATLGLGIWFATSF